MPGTNVLNPGSNAYPLIPQYTTEDQDSVSAGGTAGAGSILSGVGASSSVAAGSSGLTITQIATATVLNAVTHIISVLPL